MVKSTRVRVAAASLVPVLVLGVVTACSGDDDDGPDQSPGTTMPFVDGTGAPLDSTGTQSGGTVLNNQPTSPAANNAPPGDDGTG
jgi:hypothetical protein